MRVYCAFISLIVCTLFLAGHTRAQEQPETTLESITVTANKQEEDIQKVPIAVSAVGEVEIEDKNISSLEELANFVPNLILTGQAVADTKVPTTRGITAEIGTFSVSTGLFVDGVPVLSSYGFEDALLDVERVEVLRGPQGTLYGKNAQAGVINLITRQPGNDFRGKVSADGGEDDKREFVFNVSGPIVQDKFFFGLTGQHFSKEGFITHGITGNPVNDREKWFGKGQLRWTPTDALDINLIISQVENDNDGISIGLNENGANAFGLEASGDRVTSPDLDGVDESTGSSQALKVSYDLGDSLNLTSITTHRLYETFFTADFDLNPIEIMHGTNDADLEKTSQELRLSSNTDRMRWVAGLYYDNDDDVVKASVDSIVPMIRFDSNVELEGEAYAVFGQLRYAVTSQMGITGGLRYEYQEKEMNAISSGRSNEDSWDDIAPKFAVDYSFTPEIMGYATVAKGFLSGGFNAISTDPQYDSYDREDLWSYEIGAKTQLLDNRLILNAALFYMDVDGMQVSEFVNPYTTYITNAATAVSYGAELEMQAKITSRFTLTGSFGYTNAEFDEFQDALGDYKDNKVPHSPEYTFSLGGRYRAMNGFYAGADLVGYGKMYIDAANNNSRGAYQLVNVKTGYEADNWDIYLYAKNLFDEDYTIDGFSGGFYKLYSPPREAGVKLSYRF